MVFAAAAPANRAPVHRDRSCPHHQSHPHFCTLVEAEWHGLDAVEKIHDLTGTFAVTVLVIAIWISALALRSRPRPSAHFGFENLSAHLRAMAAVIPTTLQRAAAAVLIAGIFGVGSSKSCRRKLKRVIRRRRRHFSLCEEVPRKRGCNCRATSGTSCTRPVANIFALAIRGWGLARLFIFFGNRRRGIASFSSIGPTSVCPASAGKAPAYPNRSRSIFPGIRHSSIFFDFGAARLKFLSCEASGETATLLLSIISPIKFWALAVHLRPCSSKANAVPPPKSSPASSAEIVITHLKWSGRSQF
jgi:hypothetical protein